MPTFRNILIAALVAFLLAGMCIVLFSGCWARNGVDFDAHLRPVPDQQPEPKPKPHPLRPRQ